MYTPEFVDHYQQVALNFISMAKIGFQSDSPQDMDAATIKER